MGSAMTLLDRGTHEDAESTLGEGLRRKVGEGLGQ